MAYQFAGFLAPSETEIIQSAALPPDAIARRITVPFHGVGIRMPSLVGKTPSPDEIKRLAAATGIVQARSWLYIAYSTWGQIDSVYACGVQDSVEFGPVDDSDDETVRTTYIEIMARIGVDAPDALHFAPFVRGFWAPQA